MATIYDVAKLAGVSPATVSRVFNGVRVSEEKAAAVRSAADRLSFSPSRAARALRTQSTEVLALVIPDIENPYFTEVARGVEDVAQASGFSVVLCNSDADLAKEATYLRIAVSDRMAGVIIAGASPETDVAAVLSAGHAVVAIDRPLNADVDTVTMANRDAGRLATEHLLQRGHRRIACVTGPERIDTARERAQGWREALESAGVPVEDDLLMHSSFRVAGGREAGSRLLDRSIRPDAVVAGNNLLAVGIIQQLSLRHLTPADVGIAVVGSLPFTTLAPDAVTVVRLPAREMGAEAARLLIARIAGEAGAPRRIVLSGELRPART